MSSSPHHLAQLESLWKSAAARRLIESNIIGILMGTWDGHIVDANDAFLDMVGYTREELLAGQLRWRDLTPPEQLALSEDAIAAMQQTGSCRPYQKEYVHKDGRRIPVLVGLTTVDATQKLSVGFVLELSKQKQAEAALREETEVVETINRLALTLSGQLDLDKLVQAATDAARELTQAQFAAFFYNVSNSDGESYMLYTLSGVPRERFAQFPMPRNTELFGPTFRGERAIRLADVKEDPRYGKSAPYHGMPPGHLPVASYLAVPVVSRTGAIHGGIFLGHEQRGVFTERHERILAGLTAQIAIAIDNARLYDAAQRARQQAEDEASRAKELIQEVERSKLELQEKIEELEQFHDVVIDRELKMIELERELHRLQGEAPPSRPIASEP